jgi:agmatinase
MDQINDEIAKIQAYSVAMVGIPFDNHSSFSQGAALGPQCIREALSSPSSNMCTENHRDLAQESRLVNLGDLIVNNYINDISPTVSRILEKGAFVISLGGDHSITYPILKSYAKKYKNINILQLDAHPDLYDEWEGSKFSHCCPFARIMEEKLAARLVQVGIRTMNLHQQQQAANFDVETIQMKAWDPFFKLTFDGPVYISLDMDVLDPAFAPGISHYEPGGLSTREVLGIIQDLDAPIVGADIVELNPKRDINNMTAMVAAKFLKEIVEKMLGHSQSD